MVQIAPPAGWVPPAELAATIPLAAAAIGTESSVSIPAQNAAAATAATNYLPTALLRLFHSTALWWSAGGIAAVAATSLAVGLVWHSSGSATGATPPTSAADATPVVAAADAPSSAGVCQGLAAAMDKESQLELPPDDSAEKVADSHSATEVQSNSTTAVSKSQNNVVAADDAIPDEVAKEPANGEVATAAQPQELTTKTLTIEPVSEETTIAKPAAIHVSSANTAQYASNDASLSPHDSEINVKPSANVPPTLLHYGPRTQDAAHRTNIADQVSMPIKSFEMQAAPLSRVLETLANLAAVPMAVDPAVLSVAGVSPDAQITVSAQDTTVGKLLGTVLREHNLACEVRDGQLVVVTPNNLQRSGP
jgi:hypothetical protein